MTLPPETGNKSKRPPLPKHARLTFDVNKGTSQFRVGEVVHTLEIDNGHYVLHAVTQTVGLVKLFKSYELIQDSSGSYDKNGLQPDQFFEERIEKNSIQRITAEFDHAAQRARFSHGGEAVLPPDTQDILSIMYQFPPLTGAGKATVFVSNGKKIERYQFKIVNDEEIDTSFGKLHTVHLSKLRAPDEAGLEIWLARKYHLFPVKIRYIEKMVMSPARLSSPTSACRKNKEQEAMLLTEYRLDLVIQALRAALKMEHPADAVLRHFFQAERIGSNERSLVAETLFGVLRHRLFLEHACTLDDKGQATARRMALAYWVKFGGYNLRELEPLLKPKEAEWLGKAKSINANDLPLSIQAEFPEWIVDKLRSAA